LSDGAWLNDEVIHAYLLLLLGAREARLSREDPNRRNSIYFQSFFETRLNERGNQECPNQYTYDGVKKWSGKALRNLKGKQRTYLWAAPVSNFPSNNPAPCALAYSQRMIYSPWTKYIS